MSSSTESPVDLPPGPRRSGTVRDVFLSACESCRAVLGSTEVEAAWDRASALDHLTVGALAGHLARAVTSVDTYLDLPVAVDAPGLDAPGYFLSIDGLVGDDPHSELHLAIRRRAEEESARGHAGVLERWDTTVPRLATRFDEAAADRRVRVLGDRVLSLDEYLVTRLVELLVHTDDLAASVRIERPAFPPAAESAVIECLVEIARRRHGSAAVITAMTRRERDTTHALRVL